MQDESIFDTLEDVQRDYAESHKLSEGVWYCPEKLIQRIYCYTNSQYFNSTVSRDSSYHIGGEDYYHNERPFRNIINQGVELAVRLNNLDTKNINLEMKHRRGTSKQSNAQMLRVKKMLLSDELSSWIHDPDVRFHRTLDKLNRARSRYGTGILKRTFAPGTDHRVNLSVVNWLSVAVDPFDIVGSPIIERHFMSRSDLQKKRKVWSGLNDNWDGVMRLIEGGKKEDEGARGFRNIEICEIQGELPKKFISGEKKNDDEPVWMTAFVIKNDSNKKDGRFVLHTHENTEGCNYRVTHYIEKDNRGIGEGVSETGFQAQTQVNTGALNEAEILQYLAKIVYADKDGRHEPTNVFGDVDTGTILRGNIQQVSLAETGQIAAAQSFQGNWSEGFRGQAGLQPAITGERLPSGTPLGSVHIQNTEAKANFAQKRQEFGSFIEDVFTDWVLPEIKYKINKKHVITKNYSVESLDIIDGAIVTNKANKVAVDKVLSGGSFSLQEYQETRETAMRELREGDSVRMVEIPDNFFENIESELRIVVANEKYDKSTIMQSLLSLLNVAQASPDGSPELVKSIIDKIIDVSDVGIMPTSRFSPPSPEQEAQRHSIQQQQAQAKGGISSGESERIAHALAGGV